jgi:hypothetical protein
MFPVFCEFPNTEINGYRAANERGIYTAELVTNLRSATLGGQDVTL